MIAYRHRSAMVPPDLSEWEHRDSAVALCHQGTDEHQYAAVADPILWQIPSSNAWRPLTDGWEAAIVRNKGGVTPSRDLARLACWAPVLTVEDAKGEQWLAPVILTQAGHRAFPVSYSGPDFLPDPTAEQIRAEAIAREARAQAERERDGGEGPSVQVACRWAAVLLSITSHVSPETIAAVGVLDTTLVSRILLAAVGLDRRLDGEV